LNASEKILNITTKRLRELIKEELVKEQIEQPFRTGLSDEDIRSGAAFDNPATEPERLGDMLAAAMEGGIRDVLQSEFGEEEGMQMFDRHLAGIDEDILDIAMRMRDAVLELAGEPEGVLSTEEGML
tara:strand:- start:1405 stop:1785 length:381 start_codon:yes stop_codon:yes gene_type:complete